jgi:RNA polymerase sigma factor (sigma-70 family)
LEGDAVITNQEAQDLLPVLRAYFRKHGQQPDVAEDLTQETIMRVMQVPRDSITGPLRTYALGAAHNRLVHYATRRPKMERAETQPLPGVFEIPGTDDPLRELLVKEERDRLNARVARLKPAFRKVIELTLQGNSNAEVAQALNLPSKVVKIHKFRAIRALRGAA